MAVHDAYARLTPYELAFPGRDEAASHFEAIQEEAGRRGLDLGDPTAFAMTEAVGNVLGEIRESADDPLVVQQYRELLFHSIHFFLEGEKVYLLEVTAARHLVKRELDLLTWVPEELPRAGYLQLPRNLFWARPLEDAPPEALDGLFWTAPGNGMISTLVVTGMRDDRPGFSAIPLSPLPVAGMVEWGAASVREGAEDFASTLPGGELERLYSVETHGEVLKLLARVLWYLERHPDRITPESSIVGEESGSGKGAGRSAAPRGTALPYRRIHLD
jgi:hypothetical protein